MAVVDRRTFLQGAAAALAVGHRAWAAPPARPNILVFITDDQSWCDCSAYGSSDLRTPNCERVAAAGVRFNHAYVSAPSCSPSRAALLTGRDFWSLGPAAVLWGNLPESYPTYPALLAAAGYKVGMTGKGYAPRRGGERQPNPAGPPWQQRRITPRPVPELSDLDYAGNFEAFLADRTPGQPFCFWLGTNEPHAPHHPDGHRQLPKPFQQLELPAHWPQTDGVRRERANALAEMQYADGQLGRALEVLQAAGELDNTLVVVTADNGTWAPRGKTNLYDLGARVPLLAMWPNAIKPGRVVDDLVSLRDLAPTFLAAAGLAPPAAMSGQSLLDTLLASGSGQVDPQRDWVTAGLEWHDHPFPMRMIRDRRWLYIRNYQPGNRGGQVPTTAAPGADLARDCETSNFYQLLRRHPDEPTLRRAWELVLGPRPAEELYDCQADPWQVENLADRPEHAATKATLAARLTAHQQATGDPRETGRAAEQEQLNATVDAERSAAKARDAERLRQQRQQPAKQAP